MHVFVLYSLRIMKSQKMARLLAMAKEYNAIISEKRAPIWPAVLCSEVQDEARCVVCERPEWLLRELYVLRIYGGQSVCMDCEFELRQLARERLSPLSPDLLWWRTIKMAAGEHISPVNPYFCYICGYSEDREHAQRGKVGSLCDRCAQRSMLLAKFPYLWFALKFAVARGDLVADIAQRVLCAGAGLSQI